MAIAENATYAACYGMDFATWLDRHFRKPGAKNAVTLARKLGIEADKVSKMRRGVRRPTARELPIIEQYIGEKSPLSIDDLEKIEIEPAPYAIRELDIRMNLGPGGAADREVVMRGDYADPVKPETWSFPSQFMRETLRAPASRLVVMETDGDSMAPTITSGDRVIADTGHNIPSPDGVYALRDRWGMLVAKRLQVLRRGDPPRVLILSDNPAHQPEEVGIDEIHVVGRVVCAFKRL